MSGPSTRERAALNRALYRLRAAGLPESDPKLALDAGARDWLEPKDAGEADVDWLRSNASSSTDRLRNNPLVESALKTACQIVKVCRHIRNRSWSGQHPGVKDLLPTLQIFHSFVAQVSELYDYILRFQSR